MKNTRNICIFLSILLCFAFTSKIECEYISSNLSSANLQIGKGLCKNNINEIKYYTYKAIRTLEKSKTSLEKCNCTAAQTSFNKTILTLKLATKSSSITKVKTYLETSLELISSAIEETEKHILLLRSNKEFLSLLHNEHTFFIEATETELYNKIDASLKNYQLSINKVSKNVDCKEAKRFIHKIFSECETALLHENLTLGKKYFYLRTKEITWNAYTRIKDCNSNAE